MSLCSCYYVPTMLLWCDVHTRDIKHSTWGIFWFAWPFRYVASVNQALDGTKVKRASKIYVGRSMTVHNRLFCACTSCMNYVTKTFLLVLQYGVKNLFFVRVQGQKSEQIHTTKKFVGFQNHSFSHVAKFCKNPFPVLGSDGNMDLTFARGTVNCCWEVSMDREHGELCSWKISRKKMLNRVLCNYNMGSFFPTTRSQKYRLLSKM